MSKTKTARKLTQMQRAEDLFTRACYKDDAEQYRSAFRLFLKAAKLGNAGCQINVGNYYSVGTGVKKNLKSAFYWYKLALRKGYDSAANNIGCTYRMEGDYRRALYWLKKAVAMGDVEANANIAKLYIKQLKQPKLAIPYLKQVCKAKLYVEVSLAGQQEAKQILNRLTKKLAASAAKKRKK